MDLKAITKSRGDELVAAADGALEGAALNTLKTLIEYQDYPIDSQDTLRFATCLMKAAGRQFSNVVKYLLKRNADMFVTDNVGWNALFWALATAPGDNTVVQLLWERAVEYDADPARLAVTTAQRTAAGPADADGASAAAAAAGGDAKDGDGKDAKALVSTKREKQRPDHWRRKLMLSSTATGYTVLMFAVKYYRPTAKAKKTDGAAAAAAAAPTSTDGTVAELPDTDDTDTAADDDDDDGKKAAAENVNPLTFVVTKLYELHEQHTITSTRSAYNESVKDLSLSSGAWVALERSVRECEEKFNRDKKMPPVDLFEATEAEKAKAAQQAAADEASANQPFYFDDGLKKIYRPAQPDRRCGGWGFDFSLFGYQFHFGAYPDKSIKFNKTLSTALKNSHLKGDPNGGAAAAAASTS